LKAIKGDLGLAKAPAYSGQAIRELRALANGSNDSQILIFWPGRIV
jgi:hypothetical protein